MIRLTVTFAFLSLLLPASAAVDFQPLSYSRDAQAIYQPAGLRVYGTTADECDEKMKQVATLQDVLLFGDQDDRRNLTKSEQSELAFGGRFEFSVNGRNKAASGTVITPAIDNPESRNFDLIVTAAHVFYDKNCNLKTDSYTYKIQNETPVKIDVNNVYMEKPCDPSTYNRNDRAIVVVPRLKHNGRAVPTAGFATINPDKLESLFAKGMRLKLLAYNRDTGRMSLVENCKVLAPNMEARNTFGDVLQSDCDTVGGASGGALLAEYRGGTYLIATVKGSSQYDMAGRETSTSRDDLYDFSPERNYNVFPLITKSFSNFIEKVSEEQLAKQNII